MSEPRFESPLHNAAPAGSGMAVEIKEISNRGMIDLRGDTSDGKFAAAVKRVIACDLPVTPRTSATSNDISVLWLSVDQWLICCPRERAPSLASDLVKALKDIHSLVVDLSDARTIIRVSGETAREVLMKGAPVDLTGQDYTVGTVRRLRFAEIAGMVHFVDTNPDVIDLYVFRSYADHAWNWLRETGQASAAVKLFASQSTPAS